MSISPEQDAYVDSFAIRKRSASSRADAARFLEEGDCVVDLFETRPASDSTALFFLSYQPCIHKPANMKSQC